MTDRLITVAIHTFDRATVLKHLLEHEGVNVTLQNVNLTNPTISAGVRVRIHEDDLPIALRIIENQELFNQAISNNNNDQHQQILVPIDFSECSIRACDVAFRLAWMHKVSIVLLHTFDDPAFTTRQLDASLTFEPRSDEADSRIIAVNEARRLMDLFSSQIKTKIKAGEIPAVKFSTEMREGLPEETINQYAKEHSPLLIVMGTRGADKIGRDLVGSVTAEVLDTCRYPVFTVPDTIDTNDSPDFKNVIFFSNLDQEDILALDALFRLLPNQNLNVTLVKLPTKKHINIANEALNALVEYCSKHYPTHHFVADSISINSIDKDYSRIIKESGVELIAVPNKKKNIFARLFNPGLAHRLLFHTDRPMMVIPV